VSFEVIIIRNSDGARVTYTEDGIWDAGAEYRWTEGNESCDCNRRGNFLFARGDLDPDFGDCGDTEFSVILPEKTWSDEE
jgi:hypothetical protein